MRQLLTSLTITCTLLFISCKKDKENCDVNSTSISGSYKQTSSKYKQTPSSAEVDFFATLDACEKDDLLVLNSNGTFNYQDAGTACSPSGSYSSTWSLSGNTITIDGESGTVQSFNCTTLTLYIENIFVPGDRLTTTLVKQ